VRLGLGVLLWGALLLACHPGVAGRGGPRHYAQAFDSATASCRTRPALCARMAGEEAVVPPAAQRMAEFGASVAAVAHVLEAPDRARIERELTECAGLARSEVLERYMEGRPPTPQECHEKGSLVGKAVTGSASNRSHAVKALVPHIRIQEESGVSLLRDGLNLCFYVRHPHREIARAVAHSLDIYVKAIGPGALCRFFDADGYSQPLDEFEWSRIRRELLEESWASFDLWDTSGSEALYRAEYSGAPLGAPLLEERPHASCALSFWLPTEYLEEHGPERLRELALELAAPLPLCFGQVGFSFNGWADILGVLRLIRELCFRYPGMDIPEFSWLSWKLGERVRGPSWMTFLGQPVLGELGGADGLRSRLSSPGTTVQALEGERAVVTLGSAPDAGDLEQGNVLPAYRELARVLEPWLYRGPDHHSLDFTAEDMRRWERRFLD